MSITRLKQLKNLAQKRHDSGESPEGMEVGKLIHLFGHSPSKEANSFTHFFGHSPDKYRPCIV